MSIVVEPFFRHLPTALSSLPAPAGQNHATPTVPARHLSRPLRAAAERTLWNHLRDGRLGGARFRRQHLVDLYLADFVCPEARLVIELESTVTPALALHASARRAFFHRQGFQVLRLRDRDTLVDTRSVLNLIRQALNLAGA